jgi:hypothetical protein
MGRINVTFNTMRMHAATYFAYRYPFYINNVPPVGNACLALFCKAGVIVTRADCLVQTHRETE